MFHFSPSFLLPTQNWDFCGGVSCGLPNLGPTRDTVKNVSSWIDETDTQNSEGQGKALYWYGIRTGSAIISVCATIEDREDGNSHVVWISDAVAWKPKIVCRLIRYHVPPDLHAVWRNLALIVYLSKTRYRDVRSIVYRSASQFKYITRQLNYRCIVLLRNLNSFYIYAVHIKDWLCSFTLLASFYFALFEQFIEWAIGSI
jgi:hypothetical protein